MTKKKEERSRWTTPVGTACWVKIDKPDYKFSKEGKFQVGIALEEDQAKPIRDKMDKAVKKFAAEEGGDLTSKRPFKPELDFETKLPTGRTVFTFSTGAVWTPKGGDPVPRSVTVFGKDGLPFTEKVGGGSTIRVSGTLNFWNVEAQGGCGLSLWLEAIQVLECVPPRERDAASYGFDVSEVDEGGMEDPDDDEQAASGDF